MLGVETLFLTVGVIPQVRRPMEGRTIYVIAFFMWGHWGRPGTPSALVSIPSIPWAASYGFVLSGRGHWGRWGRAQKL